MILEIATQNRDLVLMESLTSDVTLQSGKMKRYYVISDTDILPFFTTEHISDEQSQKRITHRHGDEHLDRLALASERPSWRAPPDPATTFAPRAQTGQSPIFIAGDASNFILPLHEAAGMGALRARMPHVSRWVSRCIRARAARLYRRGVFSRPVVGGSSCGVLLGGRGRLRGSAQGAVFGSRAALPGGAGPRRLWLCCGAG